MNADIRVKLTDTDRNNMRKWYKRLGIPVPEPTAEEKIDDLNDAVTKLASMSADNTISLEDVYAAILDLAVEVAEIKEQINAIPQANIS